MSGKVKSSIGLRLPVALVVLLAISGFTHTRDIPAIQSEGVVQKLGFANNTIVIDGLSYHVPVDAKVQIHGTYGAYTMLKRGMKVSFVFRKHDLSYREIVSVVQLSDGYRLERY